MDTTVHANADRPLFHRVAAAALALLIWTGPARAGDLLDKEVHFDIAAGPLAKALIQFSSQSGVQVAVADSDVSNLPSKGIRGEYSVQGALGVLLRNTGLSFSRAGESAVAIRATPAGPAAAGLSRIDPSDVVENPHADPAPSPLPSMQLPDVAVTAPRPPTAEELAGNSVFQFIVHHGSTHYPASVQAAGGGLLRWRGGRPETVCPVTVGLPQGFDDFVTARVRAVAAFVGAPVQPDARCIPNVQIIFTTDPQKPMREVQRWAAQSLWVRYQHQMQKELAVSSQHAIQAWYITAGGGSSILNRDPTLIGRLDLEALWPLVIPTGLHVNDSSRSILSVVIVIDTAKVAGATIGSIADYIAMIALTVVQTPDHCDPLPSILDLMSPTCAAREKPTRLTAGDLAFLKALYYHNTGLGRTLSRDDIETNMIKQFRGG
ncbi:MAG TPA: STN domain-containing protein [Steroidobacteraceae bacterium]|nr:STN domain-containing protein [Steroidobacteraceae bacterium]